MLRKVTFPLKLSCCIIFSYVTGGHKQNLNKPQPQIDSTQLTMKIRARSSLQTPSQIPVKYYSEAIGNIWTQFCTSTVRDEGLSS